LNTCLRQYILSSLQSETKALLSKNSIGLTYELLSVDSFTEKLLCLCKDDLLREQIGISGRELLEREYTADIVYDKLIQYLEKQVKIDRKYENYTRLVKTSF